MPEKLSRRHTKYFWKMIAYHLQTWRLLSVITKTCWGAPVTSSLQLFVSLSRQREKNLNPLHNVCIHLISRVFHLSYGNALKHIGLSDAAAPIFHNSGGIWCMSCFQSKGLAALFTTLQYSYNLIKWGGFWKCDSCLYIRLKSSCTLMLIALCALMW